MACKPSALKRETQEQAAFHPPAKAGLEYSETNGTAGATYIRGENDEAEK